MKKAAIILLLLLAVKSYRAFPQGDPSCACNPAETIFSLAGKHLEYNELTINVLYENSIILRDGITGKYYKVKSGVAKGPFSETDPEIAPFMNPENYDPLFSTYRDFITRSGDKYLIRFKGTTYGPYYEITRFYVTKSGDKFMAMVSEKESLGLKLEKLNRKMTEATTDKEREDLQAQNLKLVQEELASGDDPMKYVKLISNVAGAKYNPESSDYIDSEAKFDEILVSAMDDKGQLSLATLTGKKLMTVKADHAMAGQVFVNSTNTKYAVYGNGTLTFSDGSSKSDLFNPYLVSENGKIFLAYLYYSPVKNSIMQCKIPF